jgi:alpha-ribazole phosphatase
MLRKALRMIFLLRHGEVQSDEEKRFIGWTDVPLSENGIRQARAWQYRFLHTAFERIYCSDLSRARGTAEIIGEKRQQGLTVMPALREINLGELENLSMRQVRERFPEKWRERGENILSYRPDGGESFSDLRDRVIPVFEDIAGQAKTDVLVISHAGVNRVILCHVLGVPLENLFRIGQAYACLNTIDCRVAPYRVVAINVGLEAGA